MKPLYAVTSDFLIAQYAKLGVDIKRLVSEVDEFTLFEDEDGLRTWMPMVAGDAEFYASLAASNPWYYAKEKKEFDYASRWLCSNDSTLEIGCGEGFFAQVYKIQNYIGLELNGRAASKGREAGLCIQQDSFRDFAEKFPGSQRRLFSFHLLEHFADPREFLASARTVLKPNGLMITAVPAEDSFGGVLRHDVLNCPPHHVTRWTDRSLKSVPEKFGFRLEELYHIPVEPMHKDLFLASFLEKAFLDGSDSRSSRRFRIAALVLSKLMRTLVNEATVPPEFNIPGYTVMCVHRKT